MLQHFCPSLNCVVPEWQENASKALLDDKKMHERSRHLPREPNPETRKPHKYTLKVLMARTHQPGLRSSLFLFRSNSKDWLQKRWADMRRPSYEAGAHPLLSCEQPSRQFLGVLFKPACSTESVFLDPALSRTCAERTWLVLM